MGVKLSSVSPITFLTTGAGVLKLQPLSLAQQEELAEFLRFSYITETKKQAEGLPKEIYLHAWNVAKEKADKIVLGKKEHAEAFFTTVGLSYCLYLSALKHQPDFTHKSALSLLDEIGDEGTTIVASLAGYQTGIKGKKNNNEPLPIKEILHSLCNEPYCYTMEQAKSMTLTDIEIVFRDQKSSQFSINDVAKWEAEIIAERTKKAKGIWGEETIWN